MRKLILFFLSFFILYAYEVKDAVKFQKEGNYQKAFQIYQQYKDKNITALNNYAMMLYLGKGVEAKQGRAVRILEKALKKEKNPVLMFNLANMYWYGYFDNEKIKAFIKRKEALKLFKEAAKLGYKPAKEFLKNNKLLDYNITDVPKKK